MGKGFLEDLNRSMRADDPLVMMCDNIVVIQFGKDVKFNEKTKHIKMHYYFARDVVKGKEVTIKYILSTSKLMADPLTKPISIDTLKTHLVSLGLRRV